MLTWKARLLPAPLVVPQASAILVLAATRRSVLTGPPPRPALYCKRESRAGRLLVMENTIKNILVRCGVEFDTMYFIQNVQLHPEIDLAGNALVAGTEADSCALMFGLGRVKTENI